MLLLHCPPVSDLVEACSPLEVAYKQVLDSTIRAARQKHRDGFPVIAIAGLGLQPLHVPHCQHINHERKCQCTLAVHASDWLDPRIILSVAVVRWTEDHTAARWLPSRQLDSAVSSAKSSLLARLFCYRCAITGSMSHQHYHGNLPLSEGAFARVLDVWAEEIAPPADDGMTCC